MKNRKEFKISPREYSTYLVTKCFENDEYREIEPYRVVRNPFKYSMSKYEIYGIDEQGYLHAIYFAKR